MTNPLPSHISRIEDDRSGSSRIAGSAGLLPRDLFERTLYVERKRSERSGRRFVLMLLESVRLLRAGHDPQTLDRVLIALSKSTRDTDITGWYRDGKTIGVIFTELKPEVDGHVISTALLGKVTKSLAATLTIDEINEIRVSFHVFPEDWGKNGPNGKSDIRLYEVLLNNQRPPNVARGVKRAIDVAGSLTALVLGSPVFLAVAIAIKLTSKGPVFFRQKRLGQFGRSFDFLKFRSMTVDCDPSVHRDYVQRFIAHRAETETNVAGNEAHKPVYKLVQDPRVTPIGRFLRRTSLDELPQFINVLKGDMSLVGPRPPVPYEVECYRVWHRTRLLAAKPGITGLWQVSGRSRVQFDEMVRMDLRYASSWSLWLDVKILLQTPQAVLSGNGAL